MSLCRCDKTELRRQVFKNGGEHYLRQCVVCGRSSKYIPAAKLTDEERETAPLFDSELRNSYWQEQYQAREADLQMQREAIYAARQQQMTVYYQSREWKARRRLVLERDNYACQAQLPECDGVAVQVHHVTYAHFGNEPLFDLVSVCVKCHEQITVIDRIRRGVDVNQSTSPSTTSSMFN